MAKEPIDHQYLRRAVRVAMEGRGRVEPNPMVGCVIVKDGRVIGEGLHRRYGLSHAEPDALSNCTESPVGATAYVTLEPCCHTDKQTPPCVPKLIASKISRVVIGCLDPNPKVNGKGVRQLQDAGIEVIGPVLEKKCKQLIAPFIRRIEQGRPYVTLKWAESVNGKIAGAGGSRVRISNEMSMLTMHDLRSRCDAILIGIGTALKDDPMLLPRNNDSPDESGAATARPLRRVVLDTRLRLPVTSQLARSAKTSPVTVVTRKENVDSKEADALRALGVEVMGVALIIPKMPTTNNGGARHRRPGLHLDVILKAIAHAPGNHWPGEAPKAPVTHLLIEPGPTLAAAIFRANLADRLWIYRSPNSIDAPDAPSAASIPPRYVRTDAVHLAGDALTEYLNGAGPAFFAADASADLIMAATASKSGRTIAT